ncbi:enoyl-CoA hydratase/isomerase [Geobacter metallireducens GS-15]|uniref:Enoyl-CoA hydratase/isomerase n=1 Tax=Geobacter metallireducens (strain ATCC 53774 / DSM 7210 / GS-15) TaxID=269799 RepID=Q39QH0_GEOMG|nr:enoyl-CoA hydratase/isomerase family protein [Geobacter metallireducens]ABB33504.1 enoyl-CoA hydratase/isomerase [Geobacter metallireducens GS-15]
MTTETILTQIDDRGVATLTMNRPELHNAFDDLLIAALTAELRRLEADDSVRVVILAASGRSFSAGADLSWMRRMADYTREENLTDAQVLAELMRTLATLKKPTIAQVQGAAFGGGVGLVACCDVAIASRRATFCLSEVKLGLIPAVISPYVVEALGPRAARRYFQSAEIFDAAEARGLGLVHEVTTEEELPAAVERLAATLLLNGPRAMAAAKELVARVASGPIDEAMIRDTAERIADTRASAEGKEGLSAFLEKRKPRWVKG